MFTSYQNFLFTVGGGQYTTYAGTSGAGPCGDTDDPVRGGNAVTSEYSSANSPVTVNSSTTASSLNSDDSNITDSYITSTNTFYPNETVVGDRFYDTWSQRITGALNYSYGEPREVVETISWDYDEGSFVTIDTTITDDVVYETETIGSSCISWGGDSGVINAPNKTTATGYREIITTAQSNYYKTTQQTKYFTTVPVFSEGECSTAPVTLAGNGTKRNITDNFTTEQDVFTLEPAVPNQYGIVNYYHVGGADVLFTGVPAATNLSHYRFSDVYKRHTATSYSYRATSSSGFAGFISRDTFYSWAGDFTLLALRPIILGTWIDLDISTSGSYWAGFGNSFTAEDGPAYKTLTTSSSGDTWDESNLLQTSDIGNPIEDAGPRIIQTGCQSWTQDGTTAWSVPVSTVESSTKSTLLATYSSTVSTSTSEGQPKTSTRSDNYATYTLGLDSLAAASETTTVGVLFDGTFGDYTNPAQVSRFKLAVGRDNEYSSNQTLIFQTGVFITSTENDGGGETVGTTTLDQTNGTFVFTSQVGTLFTTAETISGWTRLLEQGAALAVEGEPIYNYESLLPIAAFPINTNLSP